MSDVIAVRLAADAAAAARGDHRAFARLVEATQNTVTSISLAILRDVELSRDVAQEVYLMAWRDLRRLREPTSFLPWLRQLARNRSHQALRAHIRRRRRFETDADTLLAAAADPRPDAMEALMAAEQRAAIAGAIGALPPSAREVVVLYYREGRSAAQVAALLDLSEEAVRQRLSRARRRLSAALKTRIELTAPDATFTAAVLAGVATLAAPAAASAAVISAGKAGKAGGLLPGLAGAGLLGALAGLAGGLAGMAYGTRDLLRLARDEDERRGVLRAGAVCTLAMFIFLGCIIISPTPLSATIGFTIMMTCFWFAHFVWLPRITQRRVQAEKEEDPVGAAAVHRRRRLHARLGFAVGTLLGGGAVLASWFF